MRSLQDEQLTNAGSRRRILNPFGRCHPRDVIFGVDFGHGKAVLELTVDVSQAKV